MGTQQDRAAQIFEAIVELPSAVEQAAYLDAACGQDSHLRAEVEELLAHDRAAGSFLNVSGQHQPQATVDDPISERPGTVIGSYKLLEQIGEGGFGIVFMAEQQQPVRRLVALKVLKPGMDTRRVVARFEAERQALALMDHPHIAKVHDAGATASGRPYFVMELVKGVPFTRYCDEQRLSPRQRLELFVPVCQAVQHAHQKGVIHRDLKPPNVLVALYDGKPVPKVIDFGVAKARGQQLTDKTLFTGFGALMGTLEYMSPEQAELNQLDIDTRSDIYSLGVLLYELLTGTTPLERSLLKQAGLLEALRLVREAETPRPSMRLSTVTELPTIAAQRGLEPKKLSGVVRGELDWIVMKALEKDRNRRYETANGLAMDVQRYLDDEPVQACPPSPAYRLRKFVSRNKRMLLSVGAITASLVVGLAVTVVLLVNHEIELQNHAIEMQEEQKKTREALGQAQGHLELSDQNLTLALEALNKVYMQREPTDRGKNLRDTRMAEVEQKSFQRGLQFYERFAKQNAGHEKLQRARAQAFLSAGVLRHDLENWAEAQDNYAKAIAIFEKLADESHATVKDRLDLARCYYGMSLSLQKTGKHGEAARMCGRAIALWEKLDAEHKVSFHPSQVGYRIYRVELGLCLKQIAVILSSAGQPDKAEEALRQALRLFEGLMAEYPTEPFSRPKAGSRPLQEGDAPQSAVPAQARYADFLGHTARELAFLLSGDRVQEKLALFQKAADAFGKLAAAHPESTYFQHFEAHSHLHIGHALSTLKRDEEAEQAYRKAVDLFQKRLGGNFGPPDGYRNIHAEVEAYTALANFLEARNRPEDATTVFRQAIAVYEQFPNDPDSPLILGRLHSRLGQWDKAIADYSKAIELNPTNVSAWSERASANSQLGRYAAALEDYQKLLELVKDKALVQNDFAWFLATCPAAKFRDPSRAVELAKKATELGPKEGMYWNTLGVAHYRAGNWKAAIETLDKSMQLRKGGDSFGWFFLAMTHWRLGEKDKARKFFDMAVEWREKNKQALKDNKSQEDELRRFQTEAEEVLELKTK